MTASRALTTKIVWVVVVALLGVVGVTLGDAPARAAAGRVPIVVAHRGGVDDFPENTYPALVTAARLGQIVETDVRFTVDHVAVLSHDPDTIRVFYCGGKDYVIARTRFSVLTRGCWTRRALSRDGARYRLARYDSVLAGVRTIRDARVWPEIKTTLTAADATRFLEPLIADHLIGRTRITSYNGPALRFIRRRAVADFHVRDVHTLLYEAGQGVPLALARSYGVDAIGPSYFTVHAQRGAVTNAHADDIGVAVYNADDPTRWANLRSLGVNWIITDHPTAYNTWAHS